MKTKNKIAIATLMLCGGVVAGVGFGNMNNEVAFAEDTSMFEIQSVSLRIPDATYGEGMRFSVVMDKATYESEGVVDLTTGVLLIPKYALGDADLTLDLENQALVKVEDIAWTYSDEGGFMQIYVHVYDVPVTEYTTDLCVRVYVDDGDDATAPMYTDMVSSSVAKAADWLYDNDATLTEEEKATLKATYLTYDVFYHNGDDVMETTGIYGETISAPVAPEKAGYAFGGWWNQAGTTEWDFASTTISGATTNLYAKWDIVTYTAKVVRADGSEETVEFTVENRAEKLSAIALTASNAQYTYAWANELPTELALNNAQVFTETKTVNKYTVSFNSNGGSTINSAEVEYGATIDVPAVPTKDGVVFKGWLLDGATYDFASAITKDIELVAEWVEVDWDNKTFEEGVVYGIGGPVKTTEAQIAKYADEGISAPTNGGEYGVKLELTGSMPEVYFVGDNIKIGSKITFDIMLKYDYAKAGTYGKDYDPGLQNAGTYDVLWTNTWTTMTLDAVEVGTKDFRIVLATFDSLNYDCYTIYLDNIKVETESFDDVDMDNRTFEEGKAYGFNSVQHTTAAEAVKYADEGIPTLENGGEYCAKIDLTANQPIIMIIGDNLVIGSTVTFSLLLTYNTEDPRANYNMTNPSGDGYGVDPDFYINGNKGAIWTNAWTTVTIDVVEAGVAQCKIVLPGADAQNYDLYAIYVDNVQVISSIPEGADMNNRTFEGGEAYGFVASKNASDAEAVKYAAAGVPTLENGGEYCAKIDLAGGEVIFNIVGENLTVGSTVTFNFLLTYNTEDARADYHMTNSSGEGYGVDPDYYLNGNKACLWTNAWTTITANVTTAGTIEFRLVIPGGDYNDYDLYAIYVDNVVVNVA